MVWGFVNIEGYLLISHRYSQTDPPRYIVTTLTLILCVPFFFSNVWQMLQTVVLVCRFADWKREAIRTFREGIYEFHLLMDCGEL